MLCNASKYFTTFIFLINVLTNKNNILFFIIIINVIWYTFIFKYTLNRGTLSAFTSLFPCAEGRLTNSLRSSQDRSI
jgi:hypothetical protein